MINFKQYPNITRIKIPNNLNLSNTDFSDKFSNMSNLKTIEGISKYTTNMCNSYRGCINLTGIQ